MATTIPVHSKSGTLPLNLEFTPDEYQGLLLQRLQVYLSGEDMLLGSLLSEPTRNLGPWLSGGSWMVWNEDVADYTPLKIGFLSEDKESGISLSAAPTENRTISLPDSDGTVAVLNDIYVPRSFRALGYFSDGISDGDTSYGSPSARFDVADEGQVIIGGYIQPDTTIETVNSSTDATLSKSTTGSGTGLSFSIPNRTVHIIDASQSFEFFGVLAGNTAIFPIINMPVGKRITIILMNASTDYTVTWPSSGVDRIGWTNDTAPTQPPAHAGQQTISVAYIQELDLDLTTHLWGRSDLDFSSSSAIVNPGHSGTVLPVGGPPYGGSGGPYHIP